MCGETRMGIWMKSPNTYVWNKYQILMTTSVFTLISHKDIILINFSDSCSESEIQFAWNASLSNNDDVFNSWCHI